MSGGILGGVLGFIGQQQTNQKNWDIANAANAASAEQAARQMDFQERMRDTQYQTAVKDMSKAGLNPMLAYSQGGAGTPTGAMGSVSTATMKNALGAGVTGYQQMSMNEADIDLKKATTVGTTASTLKTEADTIKTAADIGYVLENTKLNAQTQRNLEVQLNKLNQEIQNLRATEKYTSAATGKVGAETQNIKENIAPSVDPYWYRDIKKYVPTPSRVENYIKQQYNKYKGKK
jgi:hypothetical protein